MVPRTKDDRSIGIKYETWKKVKALAFVKHKKINQTASELIEEIIEQKEQKLTDDERKVFNARLTVED